MTVSGDRPGDAVSFRSSSFSLELPKDPSSGRSYDLPLGDDLAAYLRAQMLEREPSLSIDGPILEDWGSVLLVCDRDVVYVLSIHWVPWKRDDDDRWGIQFHKRRGCLAALLGPKPSAAGCAPVQALVQKVLTADTARFREVEWLSQDAYEARM